MDTLNNLITEDDTEWLRQHQVDPEEVASQTAQEAPQDVPMHPMTIPSLLTRAKLSEATRRAEERRLARLEKRRLATRRKKWRKNRRTYWQKQISKKKERRRDYERRAGLGAILRARGCKKIDQDEWARLIAPLFEEYSPEYLTIKLYKDVPRAISRADGYESRQYYGTRNYPHTVYTLKVVHSLLGVVYEGKEQEEIDKANKDVNQ